MSEKDSFKMSQGYDVISPRPGRAYPILCNEWEYLKTQIKAIKISFDWYYTGGLLLLGAAISTIITIFTVENDGKIDLVMIEVQVGEYTGEDDIVRIEDVYARS